MRDGQMVVWMAGKRGEGEIIYTRPQPSLLIKNVVAVGGKNPVSGA